MKWIKIQNRELARQELPKDRSFLVMWKGRISICQFDKDEDSFFISFDPGVYEASWKISLDRERKFQYWAELEYPEGW